MFTKRHADNSLKRVEKRWKQGEAGSIQQTTHQTRKQFLALRWVQRCTVQQLQSQVCSSFRQPKCFWMYWLPIAMAVPEPWLLCPIRAVFIYAGVFWKVLHKCQEKRRLICLGLLSEQQATCHQRCLFVTKLLSPLQSTDTPKYFMNQEENQGVITDVNNKAQDRSLVQITAQWERPKMSFLCFLPTSPFNSPPT